MRARAASLVLIALAGCRVTTSSVNDTPDARESPQASAQPALLAVGPTSTTSASPASVLEGGPPPVPLRGDEVLPADNLSRESVGYTLSAVFRQVDVMGPMRAPEVNAAGIDAARKATELRLAIDMSPTRLRVGLVGQGFLLPRDSELRARSDRYGHVLLWSASGATHYRPLAPGTLRALFGERRFDVAPITPAELVPREEVGRRIGIRTRRVDVTTRAANASFEIGKLDGAGEGGVLLCRMLLDFMSAPPRTGLCALDEVPVRAELRWTTQGALVFELTGVLRRSDVPVSSLLVPPSTATFTSNPLPTDGVTQLLSPQELGALRTGDVDVPPSPSHEGGDALVLVNPTVQLRLLYLDGVPVAWVGPSSRGEVHGLHRGRYIAQWRTFLGDVLDPATPLTVPGTTWVGGAPDGGH